LFPVVIPQSGRVEVVGEEPLLEAFFETNHVPTLMLYSKAGTTNVIVSSTDLRAPRANWPAIQPVVMSNLFQRVQPPAMDQWRFYRSRRE